MRRQVIIPDYLEKGATLGADLEICVVDAPVFKVLPNTIAVKTPCGWMGHRQISIIRALCFSFRDDFRPVCRLDSPIHAT
jgi:hypothetical protein